jgi:hypothetical protein
MKSFKDINRKETDLEEACWVGYKKVGMKKKGDRMVPNCVKEEVVNEVYGKDFVYSENVGDMYKGKLSDTQITNLKNLWKTKKQSDVTPSVKSYVKGLDQFTKMDIKQANIKYLSNLIDSVQNEEVDFISPLQDQIEIIEMNSLVRKVDIEEAYFSADQLERLAKAYNVMKDKTISLANAKKLGKMVDGIPAGALNDLRKKKIPFISGLALSRMIKLKVPVTEDLDKDDEKTVKPIIKQLQKSVAAHGAQAKQLKKDIKDEKDLEEADLSKSQITKVHKQADDLPKKDFMKRYGKDGDAVRYATATNMVKKKLGIGEDNKLIKKGELNMNESYKLKLNSAMEHYKIDSLAELKDEDQKAFFTYVDNLSEGLSAGQKKLPPALQKAILAKQGKKEVKEEDAYDKDDEKPAKPKPKPKKEDLVGGQKKLDKDKDGDLDAKDFAALRKTKSEAVKTGEDDSEPKTKELNAMIKDPHKSMEDKPMKDMNATHMKSNVKAPVMNNGGADMAKVKDAPAMNDPMKKINATYGMSKEKVTNQVAKEYMNMSASKNKMMKKEGVNRAHRYLETKPGSLEEAVLIARGLIEKKSLNEARYEVSHDYGSRFGSYGVTLTAVVSASSPQDAMKKGHNKLETLAMSSKAEKLGVDELQDQDDEGKPKVKTTSKPMSYTNMKKF